MVWSIAKGTRTVGDDIMKLADVNGDGQVDALDSAIIYGYVSGKIKRISWKTDRVKEYVSKVLPVLQRRTGGYFAL